MAYAKSLGTTLKVDLVSSILQVVSCSIVGYGFARFKFKGQRIMFGLVIFTIIVPPQIVAIPTFMQYKFFDFFGLAKILSLIIGRPVHFNLLNSLLTFYLPAILGTGIRSGLFIYIFRQFFRGMPKELEDAAYFDGCSPFQTFFRIMVPNAGPAYLTVFLFSIVWYWNDYFYASMYFSTLRTISVSLAMLPQSIYQQINYFHAGDPYKVITRIQAGCLMAIAPVLILYIALQRYFTESIQRTGIVG